MCACVLCSFCWVALACCCRSVPGCFPIPRTWAWGQRQARAPQLSSSGCITAAACRLAAPQRGPSRVFFRGNRLNEKTRSSCAFSASGQLRPHPHAGAGSNRWAGWGARLGCRSGGSQRKRERPPLLAAQAHPSPRRRCCCPLGCTPFAPCWRPPMRGSGARLCAGVASMARKGYTPEGNSIAA